MDKKEQISKTLKLGRIWLWIGIPICIFSPFILTQSFIGPNFTLTGAIGDTIGGITAPFISIIGAILVFLALKAQIQANLLVQDQIEAQEIDRKLSIESAQLNQYYTNLKSSIDSYQFSTLNTLSLNQDNRQILYGSEAIYQLFQDYICNYHGEENDINSNPKITELISMLEIGDILLSSIETSEIPDKEMLKILTSHQFLYRIFPRLSIDYPEKIDNYYCEDCSINHGFPERISMLIKNIRSKII